MSEELTDSTGVPVSIDLVDPGRAYVIRVEGEQIARRTHYLPVPVGETERIFYSTVVDEAAEGRR